MSRLRGLILEVHRRSLWQVLGIYALGSWGAYQVILAVAQGVGLPSWVPSFALVLFLIGLPIVLATAFVQERGPSANDLRSADAERRLVDPTLLPLADMSLPSDNAAATPAALHRVFTWRRSLVGGVVAFAILGVSTTGFMTMRVMGIGPVGTLIAKRVLVENDRVVLADFSGTDALRGVVTEALRIDLMQSEVVRLTDPSYVKDVLRLMQRDAAAGLPTDAALELARREGLKAIVAGEVSQLAGSYVLTAQVIGAESGMVLAAFKATARDSTELIDAVNALSRQIRSKIGESLRSVNSSPPLWRVSTTSLPALRKYSEGMRAQIEQGDDLRAIAAMEEAVALDSTFAMAYRMLGITLNNLGLRPTVVRHALTRAYELRDRLSERERYAAVGTYHSVVTSDVGAAIDAYRALLAIDPDDYIAGNNLPIMLYRERKYAEAVEILERVTRTSATPFPYMNLAIGQYQLGRRDAALAALDSARVRLPDNRAIARTDAQLLFADGDIRGADSAFRAHAQRTRMSSNRTGYVESLIHLRLIADTRGQLKRHDQLVAELGQLAMSLNLLPQALWSELAPIEARFRHFADGPATLRELRAVLQRFPLTKLQPIERPYFRIAELYARAGDVAAADALLDEYEREVSPADRPDPVPLAWMRAIVQLHRAPAPEVVEQLRRNDVGSCVICSLPDIGRAYEAIGVTDSAVAVYRRYVDTPVLTRIFQDAEHLTFVLGRLGELYEQQGDYANAMRYYSRLLDVWNEADAELQPRIQAVQQRISAFSQRRG